ncbi:hypothetical protein HPB50_003037 [Hyalomma asiaticum]|uniref:Uncharacterized protein n=1 Tax=Hyalomma asiaticum TaxID=266040 RepID=A0ACB7SED2_HYAAI|nr:hypothetical protein HPB50_003037 [Hyalomma asiaticum]
MPKVVYSQKFRTEWLKDPLLSKWLECKASADGKQVAACKHCGCQLGSRYSDLKAHANTKKHRELAGSSSIQKQLGFTTKRQVQPGNAAEGRTALFIAEHSSIMTADHLCQLYKKSFPDSEAARAYQMRRSKCASVIKNVLGPHFKADLAQDIGDSYYSLIIDESTDISVTKFLAISIIYHSVTKSRIMTTFLNLCTLEVLEDHLNPKPYLGYLFETYVDNMKAQKTDEFSVADEAVMRESCIRFITTLVDEIRQRLPDNITVLQKTSLLSVENALCVVKEPLIPLLEAMAVPPETIEKIQNQWGKITLLDWKQISSTQSFWCEVHSYKDACGENPFAELAGFAMSMLVLPYSNAEVERTFSQLNIVKSKLRNKLKPETTNAILVVRAGLKRHQKSCFDYELPAAVVSAIGTSATYVQPSHLSGPSTSTSGPVEMVSDDNSGDEDLDVFFVDL